LIAGTYMPFLAQMKNVLASAGLGVGVWLSAVIGFALKLALPGRFDRLAVGLFLLVSREAELRPREASFWQGISDFIAQRLAMLNFD
jgi:hypothetical protein